MTSLATFGVGTIALAYRNQLRSGLRRYKRHNEKYPTGKQFSVERFERRLVKADPIVAKTWWMIPVGGLVFFVLLFVTKGTGR